MARSKQFNYFTNNNNPVKKRKEILKKVLKWLKIIFYILIFGLTLTGCVQSFTVKTSGSVGNGTEFYKSKNDIAPRVNTFISNEKKIKISDNKDENINLDVLSLNNDINFHVNEKQFNVKLIEQLIKQTKDNNGQYGKYDTFNSSIRVIGTPKNNQANKLVLDRLKAEGLISEDNNQIKDQLPFIISKDGKYLFKNQTTESYTRLYVPTEIKYFITLPSNGKPDSTLFEYELGKDKKPALIDNNYYNVAFRGSLFTVDNYNEANSTIDKAVWANIQYANDVLQMLYRYSFGENSTIYNEINKDRTNKITFAQYIDEIMSSEDLVAYNEFRNFGNFKLTGEALTKVEAVKTKLNQLNDEFAKNNPGKDKEADVNQFKASVNKYIATVETMEKISALLEKLKANNNFVFADKDQKISDIQTKITALRSGLINLSELNTNNLVSKVQNFEKAQNSNLEYSGDYFKLTTLLKVKLPKKQVEILQAYNDVVTNYLLATSYNINITNNGKVGIANIKGLNPVDSLVLRGDVSQRPITSWKEAWEFGPFFGLLVFPLARLMQSIRQSMPDLNGWASIISLIIAIVLTRLLSLAITFKSTMTQSVQEDLKVKKASIEAKYKGFENNKAMKMRKQQEISSLYSKYNLNPLDTFGSMLISIPIFLAMWRVIQGLPEIKATEWLGINFSTTSWQSLLQGNWVYLWVIVAAVVVQLLSQLLPQLLNRKRLRQRTTIAEVEALKKSERTQRIMLIVFTVITIIFTAGVQLYWMFAGIWTIGQVLVLHKIKQTKWFKYKYSVKAYKK